MRRRARPWRLGAAVLAAVGVGAFALGSRQAPVSAQAGREDLHHRDLGSPYATGVPYALALAAMERFPNELGRDREQLCDKFGVLRDPRAPERLPVGFVLHRDRWTGTDFLMSNCSLCHTAQLGGRLVEGLGNRNLRLNALNLAITRVAAQPAFNSGTMLPAAEAVARRRGIPWDWRARWATRVAIDTLKERAEQAETNAGGGVEDVDAGPGRNTPIEFAKAASQVPIEPPYGLVKIPAAWTYAKRKSFGFDGSLTGDMALALAAVEFNKGMPPRAILGTAPRWQSLYLYLQSLQPPRYPRPVDSARVARGRGLFATHCAGCHGTYGPQGRYEERIVPLSVVRTDPDRLRSVSSALVAARQSGEFGKRVGLKRQEGYVPPPLDGIWCRGPYLHNGAVPTLADLLRPARERPIAFYAGGDTGYDLDRLGLAYREERLDTDDRAGSRASIRQYRFDTRSPGNGSGGHEFATHLPPMDRRALLEYLKTL